MSAPAVTRADVVAQARLWIGTPFHHQARLRGVGVDCAGLLIGVARELGLVARDFDVPAYSRSPDGTSMLAWCDEHMDRIERDAMQPGDVLVVDLELRPQHIGIVADYLHGGLSIVHALSHAMVSRVVEHRLMFHETNRFRAAYALRGVEG